MSWLDGAMWMMTMRVFCLLLLALTLLGDGSGCSRWDKDRTKPNSAKAADSDAPPFDPGNVAQTNTPTNAEPSANSTPFVNPAPLDVQLPPEQPEQLKQPPSPEALRPLADPLAAKTSGQDSPDSLTPETNWPPFGPRKPEALSADAENLLRAADPNAGRSLDEAQQLVAGTKAELAVQVEPNGTPVLALRYPWNEFPRPSLQIAWLEGSAEPLAEPPLNCDGPEMQQTWVRLLDRLNDPTDPGSTRVVRTLRWGAETTDGRELSLRGRVNAAGKELAYGLERESGTALLFYVLNAWADENGGLAFRWDDLDLVKRFATPGKIQVWFLSNEQPVWNQTLSWPGRPNATVAKGTKDSSAKTPLPATAGKEPTVSVPGTSSIPGPIPTKTPLLTTPAPAAKAGPQLPAGPPTLSTLPPANKSTSPTPTPPIVPSPTPAPVVAPAVAPSNPPAATVPSDPAQMSIQELAVHIEKQYKEAMSPKVRKYWASGFQQYFHGKDPVAVRRNVFLSMLRDAYDSKPPKELAELFKILFLKLDAEQKAAERR